MPIDPMTPAAAAQIARRLELGIEDFETYSQICNGRLQAYAALDGMPDNIPPVKYVRANVHQPDRGANPHNAWAWKADIRGTAEGKLKGKTVAIKDNVLVAGVPMSNGSSTLNGYVPDFDATVVSRILDAGGTIIGKTNCEWFCFSGASYTSHTGAVVNPRKAGYSAGGSSCGSGVVVANGEVDMAVGCDQGGSIRIPSAYCGIYGLKPTYGLVPYTGILGLEASIDHVGPMTRSVRDNALLLEVIAGPDGLDPRQSGASPQSYTEKIGSGVRGLRIAVVEEGFAHPNSDARVDAKVREAANRFQKHGAIVESVSIPLHRAGLPIMLPLFVEGVFQTLHADIFGTGLPGIYPVSLMDYHRGWWRRLSEMPPNVKSAILLGNYVTDQVGFHYYGKAQNLGHLLRGAYDAVLRNYDLLVMPTTPALPDKLPDSTWTEAQYATSTANMATNTAPFDLTHHPAMSIPCGMIDGLPVGLMLIGRHYDEPSIYRAAYAFEKSENWMSL